MMSSSNAFPPRITLDEHVRNVDIATHARCNNTANPTGGPLRGPHCIGWNLVRYVSHEIYVRMTDKQEVIPGPNSGSSPSQHSGDPAAAHVLEAGFGGARSSHFDEMATIRSSGFPQRNAPNSIRRPWGVYEFRSGGTLASRLLAPQFRNPLPAEVCTRLRRCFQIDVALEGER